MVERTAVRRTVAVAGAVVAASLAIGAAPGQAATTMDSTTTLDGAARWYDAGAQVGGAPVARHADKVSPPVPTIRWGRCEGLPKKFQCATARAPLDYDVPTGPTVLLDLLKVQASDPGRKIGTLFVNPGGPGGSSRGFATVAGSLLGSTVRTRYDVVGVDPRGVGPHTGMVCRNDTPPPFADLPFPVTTAESAVVWRFAEWLRSACTKDPARIVAHMSTADTARDMDLIRQAVGAGKLDYYGISYGTYLGSVYASMFPSRVGRFVVDAVVDPVAWATGDSLPATQPFSTRLRSAKGASEGLVAALRECDRLGARACVFAGNANAKWLKLIGRARAGDLTFDGDPLSYQNVVSGVLGVLYSQSYTGLDQALQQLWLENFGRSGQRADAGTAAFLRAAAARVANAPYLYPGARSWLVEDAFPGVACADTRNPENRDDWWRAGRAQDKQFPWFGSIWTWASAPCAKWPITTKQDTFWGPFGGATANPILVVGNTYDPATPIHGARKVAGLFEDSRLLTYQGWGHGGLGNSCVTRAFDRYYGTGALPPAGATCAMDAPLFDSSS